MTPDAFYDQRRVAIVPMGFCFPGLSEAGGDLPPRKECARAWHEPLFAAMPQLELVLLVGGYAQRWHLRQSGDAAMTQTVGDWRAILKSGRKPRCLPLPHPSWRNNAWIKANAWFEEDLLPALRREMRLLLAQSPLNRPAHDRN
jgi:uracil-DNA glycosylase